MARYVIGVHSGHDSSACLFCDNELKFAIAKERLTRRKHDSGEPIECIEYLLAAAGITYENVELVVRCNWYNATELNDAYYERFPKVIVSYQHHLFHAYTTSLVNQGRENIVYVIDGRGCRPEDNGGEIRKGYFEAESIYHFKDNKATEVSKIYKEHIAGRYRWGSHMDTIGYVYADVSRVIFQDYNAAGKVMALASYGKENPDIPKIMLYDKKELVVNSKWLDFLNSLEIPLSYESCLAKDICYSLQKELEEYLNMRIMQIQDIYPEIPIGLGGGVALNCKNNGMLVRSLGMKKLGLFPACGDDGISIGAALWAIREIYEDCRDIIWRVGLGRDYCETKIQPKVIEKIAQLLHEDEVVALYERGSEYGPRALCHRSILASPKHYFMRTYLNDTVKKRERFRPFGGVVLERNVRYLTDDCIVNDYMLVSVNIKKEVGIHLPALIHEDGTIRIQVIREQDILISHILNVMESCNGEKVLINTSFNGKNEPIVETIDEAIESAKRNGIRYLVIGGELLELS